MKKILLLLLVLSGCVKEEPKIQNQLSLSEHTIESNLIHYSDTYIGGGYIYLDFIIYTDLIIDEQTTFRVNDEYPISFIYEELPVLPMQYYTYAVMKGGIDWPLIQQYYELGDVNSLSKASNLLSIHFDEWTKNQPRFTNAHIYLVKLDLYEFMNTIQDDYTIQRISIDLNGEKRTFDDLEVDLVHINDWQYDISAISCCTVGKEVDPTVHEEVIYTGEIEIMNDLTLNQIYSGDPHRELIGGEFTILRNDKVMNLAIRDFQDLGIELQAKDRVRFSFTSLSNEPNEEFVFTANGTLYFNYTIDDHTNIYPYSAGIISSTFDIYEDYYRKYNHIDFTPYYQYLEASK